MIEMPPNNDDSRSSSIGAGILGQIRTAERVILELREKTDGTVARFIADQGRFFLSVLRPEPNSLDLRIELLEEQFNALTSDIKESGKSVEIEGKYLVDPSWKPTPDTERVEIFQGYIVANSENGSELRIRSKNDKFLLTLKGDGTLVRGEREIKLNRAQFEQLLITTENRQIQKTRFNLLFQAPYGIQKIEVDNYHGSLRNGPQTAEAEFADESQKAIFDSVRPAFVGDDVTERRDLKNKSLATRGWPKDLVK